MSEPNIEVQQYDALWSQAGYSASTIGYAKNFLKFMDGGLRSMQQPCDALEVGCGNGFFTGHLSDRGCRTTGIDFSPKAIEIAQQRSPKASFKVHDLTLPLPFDDTQFDFIWCSEVLEHLFSPLFVLQEIQRVLRPGGKFLCTVPYHGLLKNVGIALLAFERHYDPEYPHIRFYTRKSLRSLVQKAGLKVDSISACGSQLGVRDIIVKTNILLAASRPA